MKEKIILKKNPDMVTRVIDDETILLPIYKTSSQISCLYTLNKTASRVWNMINGRKTLAQIKKHILEEFDTSKEEVERELTKLLKELKDIKALK